MPEYKAVNKELELVMPHHFRLTADTSNWPVGRHRIEAEVTWPDGTIVRNTRDIHTFAGLIPDPPYDAAVRSHLSIRSPFTLISAWLVSRCCGVRASAPADLPSGAVTSARRPGTARDTPADVDSTARILT